MSQEEGKKIKLKVKCRAVDEAELSFDKKDKFCESGSYGKVRRALFEGQQVAVKYFLSAEAKRGYNQELVFLTKLQKHEHIVFLHGTGKSNKQPFIVMEFAPYSVERVLHGSAPRYSYTAGHVMHWGRQIAVGLEYIHDQRILHRDIKSSNLLLFGNGSHLKLCDFGTCRTLETNLLHTGEVGTVRYMAPEVIKGEAYTFKCDIFSFAVTLWEMIARKVPTVDASAKLSTFAILFQMAEGKRPPQIVNIPPVINELMNKCWDQDSSARLPSSVLVKKLKALSSYFQYGLPLRHTVKEEEEDALSGSGPATVVPQLEEDMQQDESNLPQLRHPEPTSPPINRTQSDLTQVKAYVEGLDRAQLPPVSSNNHYSQQISSPVPSSHRDHTREHTSTDLSYGYPPHESYPTPTGVREDGEIDLMLRKNSRGSQEVQVHHEVQEVMDPDSDDRRYVSMDENFLRFDVRQQYKKLKQAYQSNDSYASLPGDTSSLLNSRRSLPVIEPRKATGDSPYAIPGLPPDMQPVVPDENDPESLKVWEFYKTLSSHYRPS